MPQSYKPDYKNILNAALNRKSERLPLYDHNVSEKVISEIINKPLDGLPVNEFFNHYCNFFKDNGYDAVTYEGCVALVLPGGGALGSHVEGCIKTMDDFNKYPWDEIPALFKERYYPDFDALKANMPEGMKAIGGVGNGVFECVQDLVGYMDLCYMKVDDEELFKAMFSKVGDMLVKIWTEFLTNYPDLYCVCRFGDDLGFKSGPLLADDDIRELIIPQYKRIIDIVHSHNLPFLLHSCGNIFDVFPDIISDAGIDAKHSNEDQIAPFTKWVELYGDKIGNFGGFDTDAVCRLKEDELKAYIKDVFDYCCDKPGIAFGSGNSIPDYVPAENYLCMINTVRTLRGDFK